MTEIPSDVPYDNCRQYYNCEQANNCPGGMTGSTQNLSKKDIKQLQQIPVCVEKLDANPQRATKALSGSKYQQAAFLMSTLWEVTDTIKISFMPNPPGYPGQQPQWEGGLSQTTAVDASIGVTATPMIAESFGDLYGGDSTTACSTNGDCTASMGDNYTCINGSCMQDLMPKWYTKAIVLSNTVETLTPEEEDLEKKVREMDPKEAIKYIVQNKLQPLVGLKFVFVEDGGDIRINLDNRDGSWSLVGIQCRTATSNEPTMNFGWLDVATVIHEFCHALGMIHEHQNPQGKGIDWNTQRVFQWANSTQGWDMYTTCANIIKKYQLDTINGSQYDSKSIMLYSFPGELTNNNVGTTRNIKLSDLDKEWLSRMYPPDGKPRTITTGAAAAGTNENADNANNTGNKEKSWTTLQWVGIVIGVIVSIGLIIQIFRGNETKAASKPAVSNISTPSSVKKSK